VRLSFEEDKEQGGGSPKLPGKYKIGGLPRHSLFGDGGLLVCT